MFFCKRRNFTNASSPRGTAGYKPEEVLGNNRSVMPFDVLGCTRATMVNAASFSSFK
jgi:hypothetical protein